ncbi:MAG: CopD family protein [Holophagales bacterium]|nr:CopD family protein [Holophagales bacterium]
MLALPVLLIFGLLGLAWLDSRRARAEPGDAGPGDRVIGLWGVSLACALLLVLVVRLLSQSFQIFGGTEAFSRENLQLVALESRWGARWRWQVVAAVVAMLAFLGLARLEAVHRSLRWTLATLGALGLASTLPMIGHAAGDPILWAALSAHLAAVGLWQGTLFLALVASWLPGLRSAASREEGREVRRARLLAFRPLAALSALGVMVSGVVLAVSHIPTWTSLVDHDYGRLLGAKILLALTILGLGGASSWLLRTRGAETALRTALAETGLFLLAIAVSAALASSIPP